jgi:hypothetical protein
MPREELVELLGRIREDAEIMLAEPMNSEQARAEEVLNRRLRLAVSACKDKLAELGAGSERKG